MSDKEIESVEQDSAKSNSSLNVSNSRRGFFKKAAVGSALITSIAAKPVWGGNDNCTVSGMISGNLSHDVNNDHCDGYGFSPGGWKGAQGHPSIFPPGFSRDSATLAYVNTLMTNAGSSVQIEVKTSVPLTTLLQDLLEYGGGDSNLKNARRLAQGILNTVAFSNDWYVEGGIYPKNDASGAIGNMSYNGDPYPFLHNWPYGLEDVVESYNNDGIDGILQDIANSEF